MDFLALEPGHQIRCLTCRRWHTVKALHAAGTEYTIRMLYFECRGGEYFAGLRGTPSRHETRPHDGGSVHSAV